MAVKKKLDDKESSSNQLRVEAEKKVARLAAKSALLKKQDLDKLVHELQVHQVELEMQNEELRRTEASLQTSREQYFELYDIAPVGYFSISEQGIILEANLTGANMLGVLPRDLRAKRFPSLIFKADQDVYYLHRQQLFETRAPQLCEMRVVRKDGSLFWARVEAAMAQDGKDGEPVCRATISDITAQRAAEEALRVGERKHRDALQSIIVAMSKFNESRDPYTTSHEHRVTELTCAIAAGMGLPQEQIDGIRLSSYIHDSGKLAVPLEILMHQGKLTEIQMSLVRAHPQNAYNILIDIEFPWPIALTVWQHHERLDGSGYPQGLKGGDIILQARILAVADVVEAMASARPYRPALGIDKALEEISNGRGKLYDPAVVDACLKLFQKEGFKFTEPGLQDVF